MDESMKAMEAPETYPIQFRDKIDEYLWKEHHIIGGCCSSIEGLKYSVAREVAEKLTDAFIEKACEWLKNNIEKYYYLDEAYDKVISIKNLNNDFKNYIKGEKV